MTTQSGVTPEELAELTPEELVDTTLDAYLFSLYSLAAFMQNCSGYQLVSAAIGKLHELEYSGPIGFYSQQFGRPSEENLARHMRVWKQFSH